MKKTNWLAVLLCAVLALGAIPAANAAFTDIDDAETARAAATLAGLGIIDSAANYRPADSLTRAEACKMLTGAMGLRAKVDTYAKKTLFSDVKGSAWYVGYVNLAYAQGIISGRGDGTFAPDGTLSYGQLATMLLRMLGYTSAETGSVWPTDQINYCESLGISDDLGLVGDPALTRAQAAVMICRTLKTDKNGTNKPYYAAMEGVASTADAILMDTNASTGGASGLAQAYLIDGGAGTAYYTQANPQSADLTGCAGTLLFDAAGRVSGFIPDGTGQLDVKLASADASSITDSDGKNYRIASGAKAIVGGEVYAYASTGYLQLSNQKGKTVRLYCDDNGAISYVYLANGTLGDTVAAVASDTPAATALARQLGVTSADYSITKNGAAATASDLAKNDVGYYDALSLSTDKSGGGTTASIRNSAGSSQKYHCALANVSASGYVGVTLGTSAASGSMRLSSVKKLAHFSVAQDGFFEREDRWYAACDGTEYPVSDLVEIYLADSETWTSGTDALITLLSGEYRFSAYYDDAPSSGGQIRVIVAS